MPQPITTARAVEGNALIRAPSGDAASFLGGEEQARPGRRELQYQLVLERLRTTQGAADRARGTWRALLEEALETFSSSDISAARWSVYQRGQVFHVPPSSPNSSGAWPVEHGRPDPTSTPHRTSLIARSKP